MFCSLLLLYLLDLTYAVFIEFVAPKTHASSNEDYTNIMSSVETELSDYIVYNGNLSSPTPGTMKVSYEAVNAGKYLYSYINLHLSSRPCAYSCNYRQPS